MIDERRKPNFANDDELIEDGADTPAQGGSSGGDAALTVMMRILPSRNNPTSALLPRGTVAMRNFISAGSLMALPFMDTMTSPTRAPAFFSGLAG